MTKDEFFLHLDQYGLEDTLQKLPNDDLFVKMLVGRIDALKRIWMLGNISLEESRIERNRIAHSLLGYLGAEGTDQQKIADGLRDMLGSSAEQEAAAMAAELAAQKSIAAAKAKHLEWMSEEDDFPTQMPSQIMNPDEIRTRIAEGDTLNALLHTLARTQGTDNHATANLLVKRYKLLRNGEKMGLNSVAEVMQETNRLHVALLDLLSKNSAQGQSKAPPSPLSEEEPKPKTAWWKRWAG